MSTSQTAQQIIDGQLRELDGIVKRLLQDLNIAAGAERVAKWQAATAALLKPHVGEAEAAKFARMKPGPSFTNDLVEEFTDQAEEYRTALKALAKKVHPQTPPGG
ncbi:hypothetical protein DNFV4_00835 [Nitrospira tepida]|uniref:Uncharacterized protein n=1 Tax=Nitrospira tepida TaxID=2973512 RepID=A0AA86MWR9_9BACT|nr:hypothetical protein [Nitrospira tepida]CAI4030407.1 hypothetical protein DNFV4_00835 [Nitrospira tepida]